jgi:hypothetical protein
VVEEWCVVSDNITDGVLQRLNKPKASLVNFDQFRLISLWLN